MTETNNSVMIIDERVILDKDFKMYGTVEEPLFLAKDVAEWIEYDINKVGHMLNAVDEDEKLTTTIYRSGQKREMWFLTIMCESPLLQVWEFTATLQNRYEKGMPEDLAKTHEGKKLPYTYKQLN